MGDRRGALLIWERLVMATQPQWEQLGLGLVDSKLPHRPRKDSRSYSVRRAREKHSQGDFT